MKRVPLIDYAKNKGRYLCLTSSSFVTSLLPEILLSSLANSKILS